MGTIVFFADFPSCAHAGEFPDSGGRFSYSEVSVRYVFHDCSADLRLSEAFKTFLRSSYNFCMHSWKGEAI